MKLSSPEAPSPNPTRPVCKYPRPLLITIGHPLRRGSLRRGSSPPPPPSPSPDAPPCKTMDAAALHVPCLPRLPPSSPHYPAAPRRSSQAGFRLSLINDGRGHLAHAESVAEIALPHTAHCADHIAPLASRLASPCGGFHLFHVHQEVTPDLT